MSRLEDAIKEIEAVSKQSEQDENPSIAPYCICPECGEETHGFVAPEYFLSMASPARKISFSSGENFRFKCHVCSHKWFIGITY